MKLVICLIFVVFFVSSCSSNPHRKAAIILFENKNYAASIEQLDLALKKDPSDPELMSMRTVALSEVFNKNLIILRDSIAAGDFNNAIEYAYKIKKMRSDFQISELDAANFEKNELAKIASKVAIDIRMVLNLGHPLKAILDLKKHDLLFSGAHFPELQSLREDINKLGVQKCNSLNTDKKISKFFIHYRNKYCHFFGQTELSEFSNTRDIGYELLNCRVDIQGLDQIRNDELKQLMADRFRQSVWNSEGKKNSLDCSIIGKITYSEVNSSYSKFHPYKGEETYSTKENKKYYKSVPYLGYKYPCGKYNTGTPACRPYQTTLYKSVPYYRKVTVSKTRPVTKNYGYTVQVLNQSIETVFSGSARFSNGLVKLNDKNIKSFKSEGWPDNMPSYGLYSKNIISQDKEKLISDQVEFIATSFMSSLMKEWDVQFCSTFSDSKSYLSNLDSNLICAQANQFNENVQKFFNSTEGIDFINVKNLLNL